tara:strand:+ start:598 stop:735 length:138 start_codon:yes stop_codon:yes gene_type:complete
MKQNRSEYQKLNFFKKITSIGDSIRSKRKNKHKKRMFKTYKGQGK